jgi:Meiotically up-regulated gene 113
MRTEDNHLRVRIVEEIVRLANANNGRPPGIAAFERETGIKESAWSGVIWSRWGDALVEAGFLPNTLNAKSDQTHLLTKLCEAARHFGRIPPDRDLRIYRRNTDPEFPHQTTLFGNFGSKASMLEAIANWIADKPDYADIQTMLPKVTAPMRSKPAHAGKADGSVYLIKSGKHFKIGRSDQIERRIKEISIALPEEATLEHTIATDDPPGIEGYWHRRFADRRANGEWFALTPQDVLAFKRRKFQ